MSDYIYYPASLPKPLQSGYSHEYAPSVLRTQMTDGTIRQRRLASGATSTIKCTLMFGTQEEYKIWSDFYTSTRHGAEWFVMPVLNDTSDGTLNAVACRLVRIQNGKVSTSMQFNNGDVCRKVSLTLDCDEIVKHRSEWDEHYA